MCTLRAELINQFRDRLLLEKESTIIKTKRRTTLKPDIESESLKPTAPLVTCSAIDSTVVYNDK